MRLSFFVPFQRGADGRPVPHPGTNELIGEAKSNRYRYGGLKRTYTLIACSYAAEAARQARWRRPKGRVSVTCRWFERDARRDPDNVMGGVKWLLDGIVKAGVIADDSQRYVGRISHEIGIRRNAGVEVVIEEMAP